MLELGISTLCDQQRLHRQSGVIYGKDRDCVEESNKDWIRVVQERCNGWWDVGWIMIVAGSTENVIDS